MRTLLLLLLGSVIITVITVSAAGVGPLQGAVGATPLNDRLAVGAKTTFLAATLHAMAAPSDEGLASAASSRGPVAEGSGRVPEPAAFLLIGCALLLLGMLAARMRRASATRL